MHLCNISRMFRADVPIAVLSTTSDASHPSSDAHIVSSEFKNTECTSMRHKRQRVASMMLYSLSLRGDMPDTASRDISSTRTTSPCWSRCRAFALRPLNSMQYIVYDLQLSVCFQPNVRTRGPHSRGIAHLDITLLIVWRRSLPSRTLPVIRVVELSR